MGSDSSDATIQEQGGKGLLVNLSTFIKRSRTNSDALKNNPLEDQGYFKRYDSGEFAIELADVVASSVRWVAFQTSQLQLQTSIPDVDRLFRRPDSIDSLSVFIRSIVINYILYGTTYVHLLTDEYGRVIGLRWVPFKYVNKEPNGRYRYWFGDRNILVPKDRMMVFRQDVNTEKMDQGYGLLGVLGDTAFVDCFTERYLSRILPLLPPPFMQVSLEDSTDEARKNSATHIKKGLQVPGIPGDVLIVDIPEELNIKEPKDIMTYVSKELGTRAEERVTAYLMIHPLVVGFGAGNQSSKSAAATYEIMRNSWKTGVVPQIEMLQETFNRYLEPFYGRDETVKLSYDHIPYLRPSVTETRQMDWLTVNEKRALWSQYTLEGEDPTQEESE